MGYVDEGYEELYSDINRLGRSPQPIYIRIEFFISFIYIAHLYYLL